ncbi:MAG TPA: HAD-IA family hydrolase [Vicinamibacteria bacterium]|nr:HAD-IA family hydrolase [Vicinamibacteria bacterium]
MARLLVFDLDGTLVDSSRDIAAAANEALRLVLPGAVPIPQAAILSFVGEGARLLVERCLAHAGSDLPADAVLPVYLECYRARLLDTTYLYPGIEDALDALGGTALAVLTNKPGDMSRAILDGLGVRRRFDRVWGAGDVSARKPDPDGLRCLMNDLGVGAGETWMIGDSATDVLAARAAGVRVAGVTWGFHPAALREARPDRLFDDPRDLVGLATA